jgi:hypothetical protein
VVKHPAGQGKEAFLQSRQLIVNILQQRGAIHGKSLTHKELRIVMESKTTGGPKRAEAKCSPGKVSAAHQL